MNRNKFILKTQLIPKCPSLDLSADRQVEGKIPSFLTRIWNDSWKPACWQAGSSQKNNVKREKLIKINKC